MATDRPTLVLDTNTLLRGFMYETGASGKVLRACKARRVITLLSKPVLAEYCEILSDPELVGDDPQSAPAVEDLLEALRFVGEYLPTVRPRFELPRDPDDAIFIELAIAGSATHIITHDKDLLQLRASRSDAGRRFRQRLPQTGIVTAAGFLQQYADLAAR
jgi:putative PIN family toxin of toxin-antitoxin system